MCKRLLAILLTLAMCLLVLAGCGEDPAPTAVFSGPAGYTDPAQATTTDPNDIHPLLYKVTDDSGNVVWLFGSIHVGLPYFYPLPDYILTAYEGSDALAVEADILAFESDYALQTKLVSNMMYTDGTTIKDHISEETYNGAVEVMTKSGLYMSLLDMYTPSMWYSFVESCAVMQCGYDVNLGIDRHLLQKAKDSGKEILEIESAEFQYDMLANFSPELQVYLLESTVESCSDPVAYKEEMGHLVTLWETGDEAAFSAYLNAGDPALNQEEEALYEEFNTAMITSRNDGMTQYAVEALESGREIFICVGAAHVVGDGAMAQQLRQLGYTVEIVG